jgi:hypothetical protein
LAATMGIHGVALRPGTWGPLPSTSPPIHYSRHVVHCNGAEELMTHFHLCCFEHEQLLNVRVDLTGSGQGPVYGSCKCKVSRVLQKTCEVGSAVAPTHLPGAIESRDSVQSINAPARRRTSLLDCPVTLHHLLSLLCIECACVQRRWLRCYATKPEGRGFET